MKQGHRTGRFTVRSSYYNVFIATLRAVIMNALYVLIDMKEHGVCFPFLTKYRTWSKYEHMPPMGQYNNTHNAAEGAVDMFSTKAAAS